MKHFIISTIIGLLLCCSSFSMTFNQAKNVYKRILIKNHITHYPLMLLVSSSDVQAASNWQYIYINTGMLRFLRNENELALVIGHELAHYKLWHVHSTWANEYAADSKGAFYTQQAGYSICNGAAVLLRFNDRADKTHPDTTSRYLRLGCSLQ